MNESSYSQLINLLGFAIGLVLYALLFAMTLQHKLRGSRISSTKLDLLLLIAAVLGLLWNFGELFEIVAHDFNIKFLPVLSAISHTALGFLPAVIVHLTVKSTEDKNLLILRILTFAAYILSSLAAILHFKAAILEGFPVSDAGLQTLTIGYLTILSSLFLLTFRQRPQSKTILVAGLTVFAVSALHLSRPQEENYSWIIEIVGHQSSLLLALAILFQDFRFAFADLFLKRTLSLLLLAGVAFGLYVYAAEPLISLHEIHGATDSQPIFILLGFWIATALIYSHIHRFAVWFVDKVLLQRANYERLRVEIAAQIGKSEKFEVILEDVCQSLGKALTAKSATWREMLECDNNQTFPTVNFLSNNVEIYIPTAEPPCYLISLRQLSGGRRLLSDEIEMLSDVTLIAARRIDALRVSHQRCEQEIREQAIGKLISEAELRALRAQLNPHFLFNALTTIGYLIQTAPDKALQTLLQLTQLLRGVLRSTKEFSTLGEEIKLIESYLEIEKARFEERLEVKIQVAPELLKLQIPSLILQPLVENAIKHGISKKKSGGEVRLAARIEYESLILEISDTGVGVDEFELIKKRESGVGLNNIENRLQSYFPGKAELEIESVVTKGTTIKISLPLAAPQMSSSRQVFDK